MDSRVWTDYNAAQARRSVRQLCLDAMALAGPGHGRQAIDLGCGAGKETLAMLNDGWRVYAVDSLPDTRERMLATVPAALAGQLSVEVSPFEDLGSLPEADLIHAGYSLPFIHPGRFGRVWRMTQASLGGGGVIAVNLFGDRDSWADVPEWNFHTEAEARQLFESLEILKFEVFDADGQSFRGPKHWHIFDVIGRRP
ncbi:Trans-aconitate 2-methyltransferase [Arthrobacter sp. SO5]|nr:Trans-aconitate 2-methyltransferase [Arthrobacter sp. SO5]